MKFVELRLDGFGKLVNRNFVFAPGLNLAFGPNEAGKSTLQQALLALLYGFYDEGSITKAKREFAKTYDPWTSGVDFSGALTYQLDSGRVLRAVRSFSKRPTTRLETHPEGHDAALEYRSASHGRLYFADAQLGMGKRVFESTCVVRQAELVALEESAMAITDTLMRLSASASQDTTTADAIAVLEKALRDDVGSDRAWTKPLVKARQRLEKLQAAQELAMESRREAFSLIAELNEAQAQLEALDEEIERLRYLAASAELQAIQAQLDASLQADAEAERLSAEVERWQPWAEFPVQLRDEMIRAHSESTRLAKEIKQRASRVATVRQLRADLADNLKTVEAEVAALADARDVPKEQLPQIQRFAAQWEAAQGAEQRARSRVAAAEERLTQHEQKVVGERANLTNVVDLGPAGVAQLEQRWIASCERVEKTQSALHEASAAWQRVGLSDEQYQDLEDTARQIEAGTYVEERPRKGCRFWKQTEGAAGPPPEATIYAQVRPVRQRLAEACAEAQTATNQVAAVEAEARQYLMLDPTQELDQAAFGAVGQRLDQYTRLASEADILRQSMVDARSEAQEAQRQARTAERSLAQALEAVGHLSADLRASVRAFEQACEHAEDFDDAMAELRELRAQDRLLAQEEEAQEQRRAEFQAASQSLRAILRQAGIAVVGDALVPAVADFEKNVENYKRWRHAKDRLESALERPASGLTRQERETARRRLQSLQAQIETWRAYHADWAELTANRDAHAYRTRGQEHERERQIKQKRCTQLRELIQRITRDLRHPAELAEEVATIRAEIRRLEYLRDVLSLARDELEAATQQYQRVFAPRLERIVAEGMARVTQGRYSQVSIDPGTLAVSLVAPEREELVDSGVLSTGTRDLIYLLLRIGIGRLMSRTGEILPLLLDDPLVQFDRGRKQNALQLLEGLASETQILLFTKDDDILDWFREELDADKEHRLHILT